MKGVYSAWLWTLMCMTVLYRVDGVCPVSHRNCFCNKGHIDCSDGGLTDVPTFTSSGGEIFESVDLRNNRIREVNDGAFKNINVSVIRLDGNMIESISNDAFRNIEHILNLTISNNKLTELPAVIGNLFRLKNLNVMHNPLQPDSYEKLRLIGNSLVEIHFGNDNMTIWPSGLHHLQALKELYFEGSKMSIFPPDAFRGFTLTLNKLSIRNTGLYEVPLAVAELIYLTEFVYENNILTGDSGILRASFPQQIDAKIERLILRNNSLSKFPTAMKQLRNLNYLVLDNNHFWVVDDYMVRLVESPLAYISMQNCELDRIPQPLLNIIHLSHLDLSYNHITSVYRNDLMVAGENQTNLVYISIANNPVAYISESSFLGLPSLATLNLTNTMLTTIPKALKNPPNLSTIYLDGTDVECTCDLDWMSEELRQRLTIHGDCETITQPIEDYIKIRLRTC